MRRVQRRRAPRARAHGVRSDEARTSAVMLWLSSARTGEEQRGAHRPAQSHDKTVIVRIPKDLQVQDLVDVLQIGSDLKLNFSIATSK
jgi:hypothetical protein